MTERDNLATVDLLTRAGVDIYEEDVALWTDEQVKEAENWASAVYLGMEQPDKPKFLETETAA